MIPYLHNDIFKVNNFLESLPSFWIMRSQRSRRRDKGLYNLVSEITKLPAELVEYGNSSSERGKSGDNTCVFVLSRKCLAKWQQQQYITISHIHNATYHPEILLSVA